MGTNLKDQKFLNIKEVAAILGIAEKTVRKYVWQRTIPYFKIGGHVRFDSDKIINWLEEREVPTYDELGNRINHRQGRI